MWREKDITVLESILCCQNLRIKPLFIFYANELTTKFRKLYQWKQLLTFFYNGMPQISN